VSLILRDMLRFLLSGSVYSTVILTGRAEARVCTPGGKYQDLMALRLVDPVRTTHACPSQTTDYLFGRPEPECGVSDLFQYDQDR